MLAIIAAIENDMQREFISKIYYNYYEVLCKKAYEMSGDREEAKEIVQEAFVKLIEHVETIMGYTEDHVFNYAKITVKHVAINRLSKKERELKNAFFPDEDGEDIEEFFIDGCALPDDIYMQKETIKDISAAVEKLPTKYQLLLESKYVLDCSDIEIAKLMNISPASVRAYLSRARRKTYAIYMKGSREMSYGLQR